MDVNRRNIHVLAKPIDETNKNEYCKQSLLNKMASPDSDLKPQIYLAAKRC